MVGADPGALLDGLLAQSLAQGLVQEVGGRVVAGDLAPPRAVHGCRDLIAGLQHAHDHGSEVRDHALGRTLGVLDSNPAAGSGELPGVADLAAGLRVEGRGVQEDLDLVALGDLRNVVARAAQGQHSCAFHDRLVVTLELAAGQRRSVWPALAGHAPRALALGGHLLLEPSARSRVSSIGNP